MSATDQAKLDYEKSSTGYHEWSSLPGGQLESQLIKLALGDCTGLTVLDLGGGTGFHARDAIDQGAARVDIIDLSPEMLATAQSVEKSLGREGKLRTFEADVAKAFTHLHIETGSYDVVMANWVFSHAGTREVLEGMMRNAADYLKPGGLFVSIRDRGVYDDPVTPEKYGLSYKNKEPWPGGVKCLVKILSNPPIEFDNTPLEVIYSGSSEIYEKYGITDIEYIPYEKAEVVQKDPEFWKQFGEHPHEFIFRGKKRS